MSAIEHWVAKRGGMTAVAETREYAVTLIREGWTVEGPFVLASTTEGAVEDRDALLGFVRAFTGWKTTADLNRLGREARLLIDTIDRERGAVGR